MDHNTITKTGSSAILPVNITKSGVDEEVQPLKQNLF